MKCPVCNSESFEILKSKGKHSKEFLLQCNECGNVYRETVTREKPVDIRIVISEFESSHKEYIKLYPDEVLQVDDILEIEDRKVAITSIETKRGGRIYRSPVSDINTIWASSLDIPARVGISVDFGGRILSKKVDMDRDFEFHIGDVVKVGNLLFRINSLKTLERKLRKGFAKAGVTKRVYGRPLEREERYGYDLTPNIVEKLDESTE
ncbi:HVO_0476 family zinc finger protein [Methanobacterium sp. ACI-7]|uniref:HVO_0476 family zinc finger protein n=1 Tax=unclassified Methanobacterium TaxID=2627676 RepID=UPI0039C49A65